MAPTFSCTRCVREPDHRGCLMTFHKQSSVRCNELLAIQLNHQEKLYKTLIGETFEVLVESVSKSNDQRLHGRSAGNRNIVSRALMLMAKPRYLIVNVFLSVLSKLPISP